MPRTDDHRPVVCRDASTAEPLTDAELDGCHRATKHYHPTDLIPRLLATIEQLRTGDAR